MAFFPTAANRAANANAKTRTKSRALENVCISNPQRPVNPTNIPKRKPAMIRAFISLPNVIDEPMRVDGATGAKHLA